jgi:predicted DNA-binding WGR domain protein
MPVRPYDTTWCSIDVRNWGPVGSKGQERVEIFPEEAQADRALKA